MNEPTFIGIGAQKCATTWIHDVLDSHPNIYSNENKEVNFFAHKFSYGLQWYLNQFPDTELGNHAIGEFSTIYFTDPATPSRIKNIFPDIKLLLSLRDPISRLISNHKHEIRIGHFSGDDLSVEAGIRNNPFYLEQGMYATHLQRWLDYFPRNQIHIILFDDIKSNPARVIYELYGFLGVSPNHKPEIIKSKSNPSYVNRSQNLESIREKAHNSFKNLGLEWAWNIASKTGLQKAYRKINHMPSEKLIPKISEQTKVMLADLYRSEVIQLEKILDRPLDHWK